MQVSTLLTVYAGGALAPMTGLGMECPHDELPSINECTRTGGHDCVKDCVSKPLVGWAYAGLVWLYCVVWLFVQDAIKLLAVKLFDMSDPEKAARRRQKIDNNLIDY